MKVNFKVKNDIRYDSLRKFLKMQGLKISQKRMYIIECFLHENKHFTAMDLYQKIQKTMPGIGFSTVYRTLKLLARFNFASERHFRKGMALFEPVNHEKHHDHLICTECGLIIEFSNNEIEKIQDRITRNHRFQATDHKLEIYGICQKCAGKRKR